MTRRRGARNADFEAALGARIRAARVAADLSQSDLGQAVNVSFQQIQKYELGRDRVAASTLRDIAVAVGVHPGSFYDDDMSVPSGSISEIKAAWRLAEGLQRVRNPAIVKRVLALVHELAGQRRTEAGAG